METDPVDSLLERYLILLEEYTQLQASLGTALAGTFHNIARANFSAERGVRYGAEFYDDRMQATRRVRVTGSDEAKPAFQVILHGSLPAATATSSAEAGEGEGVESSAAAKPADPLRWFGLLTPSPLRQAQSQAAGAVSDVIPRLASVNAEMLEVELELRRAKKKRAKLGAAREKQALVNQTA